MLFKIDDELTVQFRFTYGFLTDYNNDQFEYDTKGPRTTIVDMITVNLFDNIDIDNNYIIASAMAICNPKDNFSKVKGRKIALQHLFHKLRMKLGPLGTAFRDKEIRTRFWNEYFQWTNYHKVIGKKDER